MNAVTKPTGCIEMKLRKLSQLFSTLDPSPFRESELALEAEDYIIARALELPINVPIEIIVHLPSDELSRVSGNDSAVKDHFEHRSHVLTREMRELFKTGRLSLVIGLSVLSISLLLGRLLLQKLNESHFSQILKESFLIFGWVAIWKPSDIFLYAWPPIARRRKLFRRLSSVDIILDSGASLHSSSVKEKNHVNSLQV